MSAAKRARDGEHAASSAAAASPPPPPRRLTRRSAAAAADAAADAADRFQWLVTRCAENGYAYDVSVAASVTRSLREDPIVWSRLARIVVSRPVPNGPWAPVQRCHTKLMHAALVGDIPRCEWLLSLGANLEAATQYGRRTPLVWAAERGYRGEADAPRSLPTARWLLARGADPMALFQSWNTIDPALYCDVIAIDDHDEVIAAVVLHAARRGHVGAVEKYFSRVSVAALRDELKRTSEDPDFPEWALQEVARIATSAAEREALRRLVRHDAFDFSDNVMVAGHTRNADDFAELYDEAVEAGLAVMPGEDLDALFFAACSIGDAPRAVALLDAGASILAKSRASFDYAVVAAADYGHAAVVRALCDRPGALGNAAAFNDDVGAFRDRALNAAVRLGDIFLTRRLLKAGADADAEAGDETGDSPLFLAAERGNLPMMQLLHDDWEASFNRDMFEAMCVRGLDEVSFSLARKVIAFFIERGMPFRNTLHKQCEQTHTFIARKRVERPREKEIKLLLELGADVNARYSGYNAKAEHNVRKATPLLAAISSGHVEHVTLVLTAGADPLDCGGGKLTPLAAVGARVKDPRAAKAMRAVIQLFIAGRDVS
jgi:ankyrin repeat protein